MTDTSTSGQHEASVQLLKDLVDVTLDPGYRTAAERRVPGAPRPWYDRPLVALGCLLIGFVIVLGYVRTHRSAPEAAQVHDGLVGRVRAAESNASDLQRGLAAAEREVAAQRAKILPPGDARAAQLRRAQVAAGQVAVHGPGLLVTLRAPARPTASASVGRGGTVPMTATTILTDRDVRSVVNELWHDGAEAVSVNEVRLTPTSAIRFAGEAVLVDFRPITSPYRIRAIGGQATLSTRFAQSAVASRYQTLVGVEGIGFSFTEHDDLELPAAAAVTPRYASETPRAPR